MFFNNKQITGRIDTVFSGIFYFEKMYIIADINMYQNPTSTYVSSRFYIPIYFRYIFTILRKIYPKDIYLKIIQYVYLSEKLKYNNPFILDANNKLNIYLSSNIKYNTLNNVDKQNKLITSINTNSNNIGNTYSLFNYRYYNLIHQFHLFITDFIISEIKNKININISRFIFFNNCITYI